MVNLKNEARNARAKAARQSQEQDRRALMSKVYNEVAEEMLSIYRVGDTQTSLGVALLDQAVSRDRNTTIARIRDERIKSLTNEQATPAGDSGTLIPTTRQESIKVAC